MEHDQLQGLRNMHESNHEWKLRRTFLKVHMDMFPKNRLVCLSNCYINTHVYGCRYPRPVAGLLQELTRDLPTDETSYFERNKVKFVKSSEQLKKPEKNLLSLSSFFEKNKMTFIRSSEQSIEADEKTSIFDAPAVKSSTAEDDVEAAGSIFDRPQKRKSDQEDNQPRKQLVAFVKSGEKLASTELTGRMSELQSQSVKKSFAQTESSSRSTGKGFKASLTHFQSEMQTKQDAADLLTLNAVSKHLNKLSFTNDRAVDVLYKVCDQARLRPIPNIEGEAGKWICTIRIHSVHISKETGKKKKEAKLLAFQQAVELLKKSNLRIVSPSPDERILIGSDAPSEEAVSATTFAGFKNTAKNVQSLAKNTNLKKGNQVNVPSAQLIELTDFVIIEPQPQHNDNMNALTILHMSAAVNKVQLQHFYDGSQLMYRLFLGGHFVTEVAVKDHTNLKLAVCEKALEELRLICWTIQTKKNEDSDAASITKNVLLQSDNVISESNIGNQLLKKMGWSGGGIGKEGHEGIVEPIRAAEAINREGLGLKAAQGISSDFLPKIRKTIVDYTRSNDPNDLVFSPDFSKEERALLHKEAQKLGLKSGSHGKDDERYLVLSRKRTVAQLFNYVHEQGGETSKYLLVSPRGTDQG